MQAGLWSTDFWISSSPDLHCLPHLRPIGLSVRCEELHREVAGRTVAPEYATKIRLEWIPQMVLL